MILADLVNNARDASYDMSTGGDMIRYARNKKYHRYQGLSRITALYCVKVHYVVLFSHTIEQYDT